MPIIKPGFSKGFRGRSQAASFGRRAHYLAAEHDRAGVTVLDRETEGLTPKAAIERMGGSEVEYHEIIISPSPLECEAIRQYGSKVGMDQAIPETARRVSEGYAEGREYVTAVHWSDDGRFHFHVTVQGSERPGTFGERGQVQKVWNAQWIHAPQEHRIRDWGMHGTAKECQAEASALARTQRAMSKDRSDEIKAAPAELRMEIMDRWRDRESKIAAQRLDVETRAIEARYESRGISGSILKEVEIEKAQIRYQRSLNDLDRAEERIQTSRTLQAYNTEAKGTAREFGKMYRAASGEERDSIRAEHRAAQVALADRLHSADIEKINARHQAGGTAGSLAHRADLEHLEGVRSFRLQQADARFTQEELRAQLTEARKDRDVAFRKATTEEDRGRIQNEYESRRLDLWEASTAAKIQVTELDYRIRGNVDSDAYIRAIARVSEQEGKGLDRAIETEQMKDEVLNLRMDLQHLGAERREVYKLDAGPERDAILSRINEAETTISQKVMAYELTMLRREYEGKADRAQWQIDREAILSKAREDLQRTANGETGETPQALVQEDAAEINQDAHLVREHDEEEAREEALDCAQEHETPRVASQGQVDGLNGTKALAVEVATTLEEAGGIPAQVREPLAAKSEETQDENRRLEDPLEAWPDEIKAGYLARVEQIQARFQGVQARQELDPDIREHRERIEGLMEQTREELRASGADRAGILHSFQDQAGPFRDEIKQLQRERLDTYFSPRAEGSGLGSEEHTRAVLDLESRASLQAVRENLQMERAALHGQRSDDLQSLERQAQKDCLTLDETSPFRDTIHQRTEAGERDLAHRLRAEERRHHETTPEGDDRRQQEILADERLAATLERITLERQIRTVRETLRDLRAERSDALAPEGTDRVAVVQEYAVRIQPARAELERLEGSRLDTYHKGQPQDRALGSDAHKEAQEALNAQHKAGRERNDLRLQQEVNRLERYERTQGLDAPANRGRREEIHAGHDGRESAIAARLEEMDRHGIDYAHEPGSPEHDQALKDLEARYAAIPERQKLDQKIRADQDAIRDLRAETLDRIQAPGSELDPARVQGHGMPAPEPSRGLEPIRRRGYAEEDRAEVEEHVAQAVEANPGTFLERYRQDERSFEGRYVAADLFKETFDQYRESPEARNRYNGPVHNSAAVLSAEQFRRQLADETHPERDTAIFLTGIPGAGKTSTVLGNGSLPDDCRVLFEGQLSNHATTAEKVQQAIDAGLKPVVVVVHVRPEDALEHTFKRFNEEGRGAGIEVMSSIQGGLPDSLQQIHAKYGNAVELRVYDRRDQSKPPILLEGWDHLPVLRSEGNHEQIRERLNHALERYGAEGSITDACYRQASGAPPAGEYRRLVEAGPQEHGTHVQGRDVPAGNRQKDFLNPFEEYRARVEPLRADLQRHQAERLDTQHKGQSEDRAPGSEAHQEARRLLESRQELQAAREDVGLERQILTLERRQAVDAAAVQARRDLAPAPEAREQREAIHAGHDVRELALADRMLETEKAHLNRTLEEGTRQHDRASQEAEERRTAAAERMLLDADLRLVKDRIQDLRAERSEALAPEGADRAGIIQAYEARLKPSRDEQERLERVRTDTYHQGQPEGRALGSDSHRQAQEDLATRQSFGREREGLALEREVLKLERQDGTRHVEDRPVREAVHQTYDAKELYLARRQADLDRRQADLAHRPGSEEHGQAMDQAAARLVGVQERQTIDRQIRMVDDRGQDLRERIRTELQQPGTDRQAVLEVHKPALDQVRQEAAQLQAERLDSRFRAEGRGNTPEHLEAREDLGDRLEHRAAREDHGLQRTAMSAEKREALEGLRADQDQGEDRRELLRKIPKFGAVLAFAAKPDLEVRIASREAIHDTHDEKERAHALKGFEMEKAHLDRTLQPGSKEHARAVELAEAKLKAVGGRQDIDRDVREVRDRISAIRTEARAAERRPFADQAAIRAEAKDQVNQLRSRVEKLEQRRLALQFAAREPVRMDSPEGRAHQQEAQAAQMHLVKDQGQRREIDDLRQSIGQARTDYQQRYKWDLLNRPAIQQEYKAQELAKVDKIHTLEVARIDAAHSAAGTTGSKAHQTDLAAESGRHDQAREETEQRDLGRKLTAMEAFHRIRSVASFVEASTSPDKVAKQLETRVKTAVVNAMMDATMGEYAVVAKAIKHAMTLGN
jgi:hypothetical protein